MAAILDEAYRFHRGSLQIEAGASREVAAAYGLVIIRTEAELQDLIREYQAILAAGQTAGVSWLYRSERVRRLLDAIEFEARRASFSAETSISAAQREMLALAESSTREMLGIAGYGYRPPVEALDHLVGNLGDGTPLMRILGQMPGQLGEAVKSSLIEGLAMGQNPRETARMMKNAVTDPVGLSKSRALTISRTETVRVHREAGIANYKANRDVIRGWVWLCACDVRSCPSCWAMHGTFHDFREIFGSHPNCRCSPAPQVREMEPIIPVDETGPARFDRLSEADQLTILGPAKFELFRKGEIGLEDMSVKTQDRNWGPQRHEATIAESLANAKAREKAA